MMTEKDGYTITPTGLLCLGGGAILGGAAITAGVGYQQSRKELLQEGVDPRIRARILPHALRAVAASLALTVCAAAGGFYLLQAGGFVAQDRARVSSISDTWHVLKAPPPRTVEESEQAVEQQAQQ